MKTRLSTALAVISFHRPSHLVAVRHAERQEYYVPEQFLCSVLVQVYPSSCVIKVCNKRMNNRSVSILLNCLYNVIVPPIFSLIMSKRLRVVQKLYPSSNIHVHVSLLSLEDDSSTIVEGEEL